MANVVFDFDYAQVSKFSLENISGVDYVNSYTDNGYTISKHGSVSSLNRPFLDGLGVKFQPNQFSVLSSTTIPHAQAFIVFNCTAGLNYSSVGNPIAMVRRQISQNSLLAGIANTKKVDTFAYGSGYITTPDFLTEQNFGVNDNADPISDFRLIKINPNVSQNIFILGGGIVGTQIRSLNGYIKRAIFFDSVLSETEEDTLVNDLKNLYA